ncbi:glutathione S-transferase N-terminal domain-containing protein [Vibrio profundi]|uniref:glutathione S-transferase N-terminal domain-containing protein n=1 Tax=Vibrio profundi TaxID=1774960 RepID=UPI0037358199
MAQNNALSAHSAEEDTFTLVVGTDSTWSLRAWICAHLAEISVSVHIIDLAKENYKKDILQYSPTGLVPALLTPNGVIHDSFAICEYLNEVSAQRLFPDSLDQRTLARSLCAEMHSGFMHIRSQCPFTLDKVNSVTLVTDELKQELKRVESIFGSAKGKFMFDNASMVDAFYAILAYRIDHYGIQFSEQAGEYQQSLLNWPLLQQALQQAALWREEQL